MNLQDAFIVEDMQIVRDLAAMGDALKGELGIPRSQELLDFAYGFYADVERKFLTLDNDFEPPRGENWKVIERDGKWLALNVNIPPWLKEVYEKRREHRKEMQERKHKGLKPNKK
jgi:hypothetical protein